MIQLEVNPEDYFKMYTLNESLVLSFNYNTADSMFEITYIYSYDSLMDILSKENNRKKNISTFITLNFLQVSNFEREKGLFKLYSGAVDSYYAQDYKGSNVIQEIKLTKSSFDFHINIWLGYSLGGVRFSFNKMVEKKRVGISRKNSNGECDYYDSKTNEPFSFYSPFE